MKLYRVNETGSYESLSATNHTNFYQYLSKWLPPIALLLGGAACAYDAFRTWRGYKDKKKKSRGEKLARGFLAAIAASPVALAAGIAARFTADPATAADAVTTVLTHAPGEYLNIINPLYAFFSLGMGGAYGIGAAARLYYLPEQAKKLGEYISRAKKLFLGKR